MNPVRVELERRMVEALKIEDIDVGLWVFSQLTSMLFDNAAISDDDILAAISCDAYLQCNKELGRYLSSMMSHNKDENNRLIKASQERAKTLITDEQRKLIEEIPNGKS